MAPDTGNLCCSRADGHTALLTDRTFADCEFHLEYRFAPQPNEDPSGLNSGVSYHDSFLIEDSRKNVQLFRESGGQAHHYQDDETLIAFLGEVDPL